MRPECGRSEPSPGMPAGGTKTANATGILKAYSRHTHGIFNLARLINKASKKETSRRHQEYIKETSRVGDGRTAGGISAPGWVGRREAVRGE